LPSLRRGSCRRRRWRTGGLLGGRISYNLGPTRLFPSSHERGLGYPAHWFLRGLLNEWGLELQHLNPTRVLHIVGFITMCEAFLGMEPHTDLLQRMFSWRALSEGKPLMLHRWEASRCRRNQARGARTLCIPPVIPIGGGMGNGSI